MNNLKGSFLLRNIELRNNNMIDRNLDNLEQNFKNKVVAFLKEATTKYSNVFVFEWRRTIQRQIELYQQGRNKPWNKVTNTLKSKHLDWLAVDIVFVVDWQYKWEWDYDYLISIAKKYWLNNLTPYETCHFECDWSLYINDNNMEWFYEQFFKERYKTSSVINDIEWLLTKCLNEDWTLNTREFTYAILIIAERLKK